MAFHKCYIFRFFLLPKEPRDHRFHQGYFYFVVALRIRPRASLRRGRRPWLSYKASPASLSSVTV